MSEEFVDDINAAADAATDAVDTGADAADAKIDDSSSATDAADLTKDTDVPDSGDADVAPTVAPEVEELASQLGWNKDHKGAEAIDAATYILRSKDIQKTMKDHNKDLKGQLNGLQGSVEALKSHNERVYKSDVKKLQGELTKLKADKKAAVALADVDAVEELDAQIEDVQKDINAPVAKEVASSNPAYDEWVGDNAWYLTDKDMAAYADKVADQYEGAPPERVFALVRQKVAEVFPDKFESKTDENDPNKRKIAADIAADDAVKKVVAPNSPVEAGSRIDTAASFVKADLSADQMTIMNQFVKGGIMTEEQYIADIAKLQGA